MTNLNKLLVVVLALLVTARLNAAPLDALYKEILDNESILEYQSDIELQKYNEVLKNSLAVKCHSNPKACQYLKGTK